MATKYVSLEGIAYWVDHLVEPDEYAGNKFWRIDLKMDKKNLELFANSGMQNKVRKVGDGQGVRFRRPVEKQMGDELVKFDPPSVKIWDKEQEKFVEYGKPVVYGSRVRVNLSVYDTSMGSIGHRLEGITVIEEAKPREETGKNTAVSEAEPQPW